jgi:hypothetical protein
VSLYVGLFSGDAEVEGWVLGHYSDFGCFRDILAEHFTVRELPLLLGCSDSAAVFEPESLTALQAELALVGERFSHLPTVSLTAFEHNGELWSDAANLAECFHNVDGENLLVALSDLCLKGAAESLPLLFQ